MTDILTHRTIPAVEGSFPDIASTTYDAAIANVARAAYTLFATPEHDKLHQVLETEALQGPAQPMQAPLQSTVGSTLETVLERADLIHPPAMEGARLIQLGGMLIQFADYVPGLQGQVAVPYSNISELRDAITSEAAEQGEPLSIQEQLGVALELNEGNVIDSLWNLFTASRLHARWLDGSIIEGAPDYSREEKVGLMHQWRQAITAFKAHEAGKSQDPNGDAYYAWTHALAKVAYSTTPARSSVLSRAVTAVFHEGTGIMHKAVHTFVKQGVASNHDVAAAYGNAVGQVIVDLLPKRR